MRKDWQSYDSIALEYASVAVPAYFARPAADLVALLRLAPGASLLDVGTGSGAVLVNAGLAVGKRGRITGVDSSLSMLLAARESASTAALALAALPDLPYGSGAFDAVTAAFVLSHIEDSTPALREMARVLKPRGKLAVTAWAASPAATPPGRAWQEVAHTFVRQQTLKDAMDRALPGEERFSNPEALRGALIEVGLAEAQAEQRAYRVEIQTELYVRSRLLSLSSRFLQTQLEARRWNEFLRRAAEVLFERFGDRLTFDLSVNFAIGKKPID